MTTLIMDKPVSTHPKLENPLTTKKDIVDRLAKGETCTSISQSYSVSTQRIHQIKQQERKAIEETATKLLQNLPDIVETTKLDIQTNKELSKAAHMTGCDLSKEQLTFKTITNKLSADILRSIGIFPAQSPSFIFNQYNIDNSKHINADPKILAVFSTEFAKSFTPMPEMNENGDDDADN